MKKAISILLSTLMVISIFNLAITSVAAKSSKVISANETLTHDKTELLEAPYTDSSVISTESLTDPVETEPVEIPVPDIPEPSTEPLTAPIETEPVEIPVPDVPEPPTEPYFSSDGITFEIVDDEYAVVTGCYDDRISTELTIPSEIRGYPVTKICPYAFFGCSTLKSINIPDSITTIGDSAFWDCSSLTTVDISNSVTNIKEFTFKNCSNLIKVDIPDSVTTIGQEAFSECTSLTSINIPDSVTTIGYMAFANCSGLTSVKMADSVTNIESLAFSDCSSLTTVDISNSISNINYCIFENCVSLTSVIIPDSVTSIGNWAFAGCSSLENVTIPNSLTNIDYGAFENCVSLLSADIPDSVTSIGAQAFGNCTNLSTVTIPANIENFQYSVFSDCPNITKVIYNAKNCLTGVERTFNSNSSIKTVEFGKDVQRIPPVFRYCQELTTIYIPNSVTEIDEDAFTGCKSLKSVNIPDSVTSIGAGAFSSCTSLTSVNIPDGLTSINSSTFSNCSSLTSIDIPDSVTTIENWAFNDCTSLSKVTIPANIESIEYVAFNNCPNITTVIYNAKDYSTNIFDYNPSIKTVRFGSEVTRITDVFRGCTALTSVYIPNSVATIDDYAFAGCTSLESIAIPESVTSIENSAFYDCTALKSFEVSKANPAYSSIDGVLFNKDNTILITYPAGKPDASYSIPEGVTEINSNAFKNCINVSSITIPSTYTNYSSVYIDNGVMILATFYNSDNNLTSLTQINVSEDNPTFTSIDGVLFDKDCTKLLLYPQKKPDTTYAIPDSVTSIGQYSFAYNSTLSTVTITDSVESIEYGAFSRTGIEEITIPPNVKRMEAAIFRNCENLKRVTISEGIEKIPNSTFVDCTSLRDIYFPSSIEEIDSYSVYNTQWYNDQPDGVIYIGKVALCYKGEMPENTSIKIKDGTEVIASSAFYSSNLGENKYKETLVSVDLPSTIKRINGSAFLDCQSLNSIVLPDALTSIGTRAFQGCSSLTSIRIPDSITCIEPYAFADCVNLEEIYIPSTLTSIGKYREGSYANIASGVSSHNAVFENTAWYNDQSDGIVYAGKVAIGYKGEMPENTELVIKDGTVSIAAGALANLENLISVKIPDSVTDIGNSAFVGCTNLSEILIPDSVDTIGGGVTSFYNAFTGTEWYNNQPDGVVYAGKVAVGYKGEMPQDGKIEIKEGTVSIADFAFVHNEGLVSIIIPGSVKKIGQHALYRCSNLVNVEISDGLEEIGTFAFVDCTSLKEVKLPSTVTKFGNAAIGYDCGPGGPGHCDGDMSIFPCMVFTISGYSNTIAELYAKDNGFNFISIGTQPDGELVLGDVDFDGKVGLNDAILIQKQTLFITEFDNNQKICADVDGNGIINLLDAIYVQKYIINLPVDILSIGKEII